MRLDKISYTGLLLLVLALCLAACQSAEPCPDCPEPELVPCPSVEPCPVCETCPDPLVAEVPYEAQWAASAHADGEAEAFRHWDEDGLVESGCATCHSASGYQDFLGADSSVAGTIENTHPVANGLTCVTCHSETATSLANVVFPSGVEITNIGESARCMVCHQGRSAGNRLESAIIAAGLAETRDTVSTDIRFYNIHYYAAAATLYGGLVNGGYQYAGMTYEAQNQHVEGYATCADCHDPHTLEVRIERCSECHNGVISPESLADIRMRGSLVDYDGDGNVAEGIAGEISDLQQMLLTAMQTYSAEITGSMIGYNPSAYPYFFNDLNTNGVVDEDEANTDNAFTSWTARLLEAAYNYQTSLKDPGAYAHNPKYVIQLLFDSIADLNTMLTAPVDLSAARRDDAGHFNSASESFRHWDTFGSIEARCARCHTAVGLPTFLYNGVNIATNVSDGFTCTTCHELQDFPNLYTVNQVAFPSGNTVSFGDSNDSNLCLTCHQGLGSTASVDNAIASLENDTVSTELHFNNPHYLPAGATLFGTRVSGAYEYVGQTYLGRSPHVDVGGTCVFCHDAHALELKRDRCAICHPGFAKTTDIRSTQVDFDGDTNISEGLAAEITTLEHALLSAIQLYAVNTARAPIGYDAQEFPYFYADTNENDIYDNDESAYASWTPRLIRAAYNYQWVQNDAGAYAHNGLYIIQVLYDSLVDLGVDVAAYTRP
jgi:hypothetical protein